jgi:hypothetical protein
MSVGPARVGIEVEAAVHGVGNGRPPHAVGFDDIGADAAGVAFEEQVAMDVAVLHEPFDWSPATAAGTRAAAHANPHDVEPRAPRPSSSAMRMANPAV